MLDAHEDQNIFIIFIRIITFLNKKILGIGCSKFKPNFNFTETQHFNKNWNIYNTLAMTSTIENR